MIPECLVLLVVQVLLVAQHHPLVQGHQQVQLDLVDLQVLGHLCHLDVRQNCS